MVKSTQFWCMPNEQWSVQRNFYTNLISNRCIWKAIVDNIAFGLFKSSPSAKVAQILCWKVGWGHLRPLFGKVSPSHSSSSCNTWHKRACCVFQRVFFNWSSNSGNYIFNCRATASTLFKILTFGFDVFSTLREP